jgi:hypothetical protein
VVHDCGVPALYQMHEQCSSDGLCTERHWLAGVHRLERLMGMLSLVTADGKHAAGSMKMLDEF